MAHIASDRIDGTRKSALRAKLHSGNKSGTKGVSWVESRQSWRAYIGIKGKQITLGYRKEKEAAIALRRAAEEKYHKPYLEDKQHDQTKRRVVGLDDQRQDPHQSVGSQIHTGRHRVLYAD